MDSWLLREVKKKKYKMRLREVSPFLDPKGLFSHQQIMLLITQPEHRTT